MAYAVSFTPHAQRQYSRLVKRLSGSERQRLDNVIDGLVNDPRPAGCEKLSGREDRYRVRAGNYLVVTRSETLNCSSWL